MIPRDLFALEAMKILLEHRLKSGSQIGVSGERIPNPCPDINHREIADHAYELALAMNDRREQAMSDPERKKL
jgi:hypothetical protein